MHTLTCIHLLAIAVAVTSSAAVQGPSECWLFNSAGSYRGSGTPWAVGDLNGDGYIDAVASSGGTILVLFNEQDGRFTVDTAYKVPQVESDTDRKVSVADLNADGHPDLLVSAPDSALTVLLNQGDGTYAAGVNYAGSAVLGEPGAVDLDGDGDLDTVVLVDQKRLIVELNEGNGTFAAGAEYAIQMPYEVNAVDVDNDGDLDLLFGVQASKIVLLKNNGDATFTPPIDLATQLLPHQIVPVDIDGDGDVDVVALERNATEAAVHVLKNAGDGTFTASGRYLLDLNAASILLKDVTADSYPDLLVGTDSYYGALVSVLLNTGDGSFAAATSMPVPGPATTLLTGDFDQDGDIDFASGGGIVCWFLNNGDGTFAVADAFFCGTATCAVDVNNDGDIDLFPFLINTTVPDVQRSSPLDTCSGQMVAFNVRTGGEMESYEWFRDGTPIPGSNSWTLSLDPIHAEDAGYYRCVVTSEACGVRVSSPVEVRVSEALQITQQPQAQAIPVATEAAFSVVVTGSDAVYQWQRYERYAWTDLIDDSRISDATTDTLHIDGIGPADVARYRVVISNACGSVTSDEITPSLFACRRLSLATQYDLPDSTVGVQAADLDGDGDNDVALCNFTNKSLSVLMNTGDGTLAAKVDYATSGSLYALELLDVDGDGDVDAIAVGSTFAVFKNNGDGTFAAAVEYPVVATLRYADAGDVDGDGDIDLVASSQTGYSVTVWKNDGTGAFSADPAYTLTAMPGLIALRDFDRDGDLDIVVYANGLWLLSNDAAGQFAPPVALFSAGSKFALSDLNHDGTLDVVWVGSNSVSVNDNNGDGTFAIQRTYAIGYYGYSATFADMDADGDWDIVVPGGGSPGGVAVLNNDGYGGFPATTNSPVSSGSQPNLAVTTDMDGDGDLDVVTLGWTTFNKNCRLAVLLNEYVPNIRPTSLATCPGSSPTFTVTAGEASWLDPANQQLIEVSYQWYKDGSTPVGGNGPTLTLDAVTAADNGSYHCVVTSPCCQSPSRPVTLTITGSALPTDFNHDCAVDAADLDMWIACATGPSVAFDAADPPAGCMLPVDGNGRVSADLDADGDVDVSDFGLLQRCLGNDAQTPNSECMR